MSARRRWSLFPSRCSWWPRRPARRGDGDGAEHGVDDQDRGPFRLPGRVWCVRQPGSGGRRLRDVRVRRREAEEPEYAARRLDRRLDQRPPAQARRHRVLERPRRHGHQGDEAPDGAVGRGHHDRSAVGRRVDRRRELREAASQEDVRRRLRRRAGHDAEGAGAELLPLQRRRCAVERRPRRSRLPQAEVAERSGGRGRLQLRLDVGRRVHRRVLCRRREGLQARVPAAQHDRLLVVCPADADERRRNLRRRRRRRTDPVPEGLRAGARPDRGEEVHREPVLGHPGPVPAAEHARLGRLRGRGGHGWRPRDAAPRRSTRTGSSASGSRRSRRSVPRPRRRRARSRSATSSTRGA